MTFVLVVYFWGYFYSFQEYPNYEACLLANSAVQFQLEHMREKGVHGYSSSCEVI